MKYLHITYAQRIISSLSHSIANIETRYCPDFWPFFTAATEHAMTCFVYFVSFQSNIRFTHFTVSNHIHPVLSLPLSNESPQQASVREPP